MWLLLILADRTWLCMDSEPLAMWVYNLSLGYSGIALIIMHSHGLHHFSISYSCCSLNAAYMREYSTHYSRVPHRITYSMLLFLSYSSHVCSYLSQASTHTQASTHRTAYFLAFRISVLSISFLSHSYSLECHDLIWPEARLGATTLRDFRSIRYRSDLVMHGFGTFGHVSVQSLSLSECHGPIWPEARLEPRVPLCVTLLVTHRFPIAQLTLFSSLTLVHKISTLSLATHHNVA